jgi:hypothetical protein
MPLGIGILGIDKVDEGTHGLEDDLFVLAFLVCSFSFNDVFADADHQVHTPNKSKKCKYSEKGLGENAGLKLVTDGSRQRLELTVPNKDHTEGLKGIMLDDGSVLIRLQMKSSGSLLVCNIPDITIPDGMDIIGKFHINCPIGYVRFRTIIDGKIILTACIEILLCPLFGEGHSKKNGSIVIIIPIPDGGILLVRQYLSGIKKVKQKSENDYQCSYAEDPEFKIDFFHGNYPL